MKAFGMLAPMSILVAMVSELQQCLLQEQRSQRLSVCLRKKRQAKAYRLVYKHVDDERIKELLDALPMDDRRGAEAWATHTH